MQPAKVVYQGDDGKRDVVGIFRDLVLLLGVFRLKIVGDVVRTVVGSCHHGSKERLVVGIHLIINIHRIYTI